MENWAAYTGIASVAFSAVAAIFAVLAFLRSGKAMGSDNLMVAIRTEADRLRADNALQAQGVRQEIGENIRGFQDSFVQKLDNGIEAIRAPIAAIGNKLDQDIARMGLEAAENREALRLSISEKLENANTRAQSAARELREELTGNFAKTSEQLSTTLLQLSEHQKERLVEVALELASMAEKQTLAQEGLRQGVERRLDALRTENSAKLDEMRQTVDEKLQTTLEKRLGESFRTVSEQLERVYQGLGEMQTLATGVGDLKRVLTNVKTRGTWAEITLSGLLEDYLTQDQFIRNAQVKAHSSERVEFAIRFPSRDSDEALLLPIDSKFPKEDYDRLVLASERADPVAVEEASASLEASIRGFARSISEKYVNPPTTTDFAILFLPTEGLFSEALRRNGLFEHLQREFRVTLAGPTTLSALLNAFQMGFRSLAIQRRSSEVWQLLGAVRGEFAQHGKVVDRLKKQLNAAANTVDALGTRTRAMNRKLKDVEVLGSSDAEGILQITAFVESNADEEEASTDADDENID